MHESLLSASRARVAERGHSYSTRACMLLPAVATMLAIYLL